MSTVGIIQARMGSTRLPGKVLLDIVGEPMLARVIKRALRSRTLDLLVVATTELPADNIIVDLCVRHGWNCFRGSENDVLDRYYHAAVHYQAEAIVRITSDCPFVDPVVVDQLVTLFRLQQLDYAGVGWQRSYPRGLDCEVMTMAALSKAWQEARESYQRAHVTPYIYEHPELFTIAGLAAEDDYSHYRWTVDTPEDLEFARQVYQRFAGRDDFGWREVLSLVEKDPVLAGVNQHVPQKSLREG